VNTDQDGIGLLRAYLEELRETGGEYLLAEPPSAALPKVVPIVSEAIPLYAPTGLEPETINAIRADLGDCHRCALGDGRTKLVFGVGNPQARLVFVGEAPGRDEDLQGEPFVGAAGQLLTKIIQAMGLRREDVYICNVLKCRPPQNRDPLPAEIEACSSFMLRQIQAIGPAVLVALGKFAAQTLLQNKTPISKLRGQFHDFHGIPLMPTFHPSALLRDESLKRPVWEDMQQVMQRLGKETPGKQPR
jgi:uracil-DNA glycosylase